MINYTRIFAWGFVYACYVLMAYNIAVDMMQEDFIFFLYSNLFNLQKYFFDVSAFFMVYLFILKRPFTSPMFVSRCKDSYLNHVILYGVKICGIYIAYTAILFGGVSIIFGLNLIINMDLVRNISNLFSFLFTAYLIYLYLLIKTHKQMFSLLAGFSVNYIFLVIYYVLGAVDQNLAIELGYLLMNLYPILAIVMIVLNITQYNRKDFLA